MQSSDNDKVISLKKAKSLKENKEEAISVKADETFLEILMETMRKNSKNKDRLAEERKNANKSVLKSYRIKN